MEVDRRYDNKTRRNRHRKLVARGHPPCHLCGLPIDYAASHLEPLSFQIDHVIPLAKGGLDELDNLAPSHRSCNRAKGDGGPDIKAPVKFITERSW